MAAWQKNVSKVLTNLGWGSGFRLPIANAENLALEQELEQKQMLVASRQAELEDASKHTEALERGLKNAHDRMSHENKLLIAKRAEIEAEKDYRRSCDKDMQNALKEYKETEKRFTELEYNNRALIEELDSRKSALTELVDLIEYDRQELTRLEKNASDQDGYMKMLEQMCEADAETVKKCEAQYKAVGEAITLARLELEKEVATTIVKQHELKGTGDRFRQLHKERGEMVNFWKVTLHSLKDKDEQISKVGEEYSAIQTLLHENDLDFQSQKTTLENIQRITHSSDFQLNKWDRTVGDMRMEIKEVQELGQMYQNAVLEHETSINLTSAEVQTLKKQCKKIDEELNSMQAKVEAAEAKLAELRAKADVNKMEAMTVGDKMNEIKVMVEDEQRKLQEFAKRLNKERKMESLWATKKQALTQKAVDLEAEVRIINARYIQGISLKKDNEIKLERRNATLYRLDLQTMSLQVKLKKEQNPREYDRANYEAREDRCKELKNIMVGLLSSKSFLKGQTCHLDDVNRRVYRDKTQAATDYHTINALVNGHVMRCKASSKVVEAMEVEYKDLLVEHSLVNVKLRQLVKSVEQERNQLYDSESHRLLLSSIVNEKQTEIEMHSRLLQVKRKSLRDEVVHLRLQMSQVHDSIYKKQKRYEMVLLLMSNPNDEGDAFQSEAYYMLKMAQDRESLRLEGDHWDAKVKEAEKETEALQNSIAVILCSNEHLKETLKPVPNEIFQTQKQELELKQRELNFKKNKAIQCLKNAGEEISKKYKDIEFHNHTKCHLENTAADLEYALRLIQREFNTHSQSAKRYHILTSRLLKNIAFTTQEEKELVSRDIRLHATQKKFEIAVTSLSKLLTNYPAAVEKAGKLLYSTFGPIFVKRFFLRVNPNQTDASTPSTPSGSELERKTGSQAPKNTSSSRSSISPSSDSKQRFVKFTKTDKAVPKSVPQNQLILRRIATAVERNMGQSLELRKGERGRSREVEAPKTNSILPKFIPILTPMEPPSSSDRQDSSPDRSSKNKYPTTTTTGVKKGQRSGGGSAASSASSAKSMKSHPPSPANIESVDN